MSTGARLWWGLATGWEAKTTLEDLCAMMIEADLRRNAAGASF
jgi:GDP-D-mannose dehydratase